MEVKPGYKQTEVGVIPVDWEVKSLGNVACIATGNTPPTCDTTNYGDEFLFVSPADLGFTKYIHHTEKMLSKKGFAISRCFPKDSILFVCIGSTIGKCGIASKELTSNQQINVIFPSSEFSFEYLYYAVSIVGPKIKVLAGEQAVPIVNKTQFSATVIPLPPTKVEQEAIAEALSDADALIESLEQLIAKKRLIKQGAMQELLTGKKRLPGFSGEWEVKRLSELLKYERSDKYIVKCTDYHDNAKTPVLTANKSFFLGRTDEDFGIYDDLPAIIFDDFTTDCKYVDFPFKVKSSAIKILTTRNQETNLRWLFERMRIIDFPLGEHKRYYISEYQHLEIPTPKPDEQATIASVLTDFDSEITALEAKLAKARQIKQGMMQELLTGRIRLI